MKSLRNNSPADFDRVVPSNTNTESVLSQVQVKTSPFNRVRQSWLALTLGLIAIAGVIGTVGVTIVALVPRPTTTSTASSSDSTTTTGITTTTAISK
jgi:hypothetical protein